MRFFLNTVWRDTRCLVPPNRSKSNTKNSRGEIRGWKANCLPLLANWQQNSQEVTKDNQTHARTGHVPDVPGCYFDYPWGVGGHRGKVAGTSRPSPCAPDERVCEKKVTQLLVQIDTLARTRSGSPRGPNAGSQASASRPLRGEGGHEGPRRADGLGASVSEGIESASAPDEVRFKVPKLLCVLESLSCWRLDRSPHLFDTRRGARYLPAKDKNKISRATGITSLKAPVRHSSKGPGSTRRRSSTSSDIPHLPHTRRRRRQHIRPSRRLPERRMTAEAKTCI